MTEPPIVRIGTRASRLALWQAHWTAAQLQKAGVQTEIIQLSTTGDQDQRPLTEMGGEGVFTKRIQQALLDGEADLAVHSLKDLPTDTVSGLELVAVPKRETVHDLLVSPDGRDLAELPSGSRIGTGSLRRQAQLLHARADLEVLPIRGNVETRLEKLAAGEYDAIILAEAGVRRLELEGVNAVQLPLELMLPAVGQASLGWEIRQDDAATRQAIAPLCDLPTWLAITAERALLKELCAGCLAPVAALGVHQQDTLQLDAVVLDPRGTQRLFRSAAISGSELNTQQAWEVGAKLAAELLEHGASDLIQAARS